MSDPELARPFFEKAIYKLYLKDVEHTHSTWYTQTPIGSEELLRRYSHGGYIIDAIQSSWVGYKLALEYLSQCVGKGVPHG